MSVLFPWRPSCIFNISVRLFILECVGAKHANSSYPSRFWNNYQSVCTHLEVNIIKTCCKNRWRLDNWNITYYVGETMHRLHQSTERYGATMDKMSWCWVVISTNVGASQGDLPVQLKSRSPCFSWHPCTIILGDHVELIHPSRLSFPRQLMQNRKSRLFCNDCFCWSRAWIPHGETIQCFKVAGLLVWYSGIEELWFPHSHQASKLIVQREWLTWRGGESQLFYVCIIFLEDQLSLPSPALCFSIHINSSCLVAKFNYLQS